MTHFGIGRRGFLAATGVALASVPASLRAAPPVAKVTPELIAAALKEGKVTYYSSNDQIGRASCRERVCYAV